MNKFGLIFVAAIAVLLAALGGYFAGRQGAMTSGGMGSPMTGSGAMPAGGSAGGQRKPLYWKAPMDPNFRSDKPGKSPMGMDLVPVYAGGGSDSSDIKIAPAVVNNLGVRTAKVRQGALSNRLEAVGYVAYDEDHITSINTRANGWIEKLGVKNEGERVMKDQRLYELFSPKLATAEREYLTALASGSASLLAASRERMRALGFTAAQIEQLTRNRKVSDRVTRRAESAGVVMNLSVREGAYVMPATQMMKLVDLGTVWVLVEVDESQAGLLRKGQKASARFNAFPGKRRQGVVDYIYPDLDPMTRTVKVRLRFPNPDRRLQPNMYAHVTIQDGPQPDVLYIPNEALIRTGQSQRVIVALGDGRFDVCPVEAGISSGDRVEILKGLQVGQRVVTSAQFMIDSEANVDAAALRLGSGKAACTIKAAMPSGQGIKDQSMSEMSDQKPAMHDGSEMSNMQSGEHDGQQL